MSVNKSFYDKKTGATQTDPDLALRHIEKQCGYVKMSIHDKYGLAVQDRGCMRESPCGGVRMSVYDKRGDIPSNL